MGVVRLIVLALVFLSGLNIPAHAASPSCAQDKRVIADCYNVHGRLRINANLRPYLWPIGSKRLLGISRESGSAESAYDMPAAVAEKLSIKADVYGDFHICPITRQKPGILQMVCIDSVSHLKAVPAKY